MLLGLAPPLTGSALELAYTGFQVCFLFAGLNPTPTPYGKFHRGARLTVPSRVGMFVIYFPAFLVAALWFGSRSAEQALPESNWDRTGVVNVLLMLHFGKRLVEVLFVHVYSGSLDLVQAMSVITVSYSINTHMILKSCRGVIPSSMPSDSSSLRLGLALFFIGQAINFYHHYLLAQLRSPSQATSKSLKTKYVPPKGGLFASTCCPHFFGEIIAWMGISVISSHTNVWLVWGGMTSYLLGRSYNTARFYHERVPSYKPKYHMIPGLF